MMQDRTQFVGGSDVPKIIEVSNWGNAFRLYLEKRREIDTDPEETKVQRRGRILEPAIAALAADEWSVRLEPGGIVTGPEPWMRAQIDYWEIDPTCSTRIPADMKSANEHTRYKWGPSDTDDCPTDICAQMHWQIALSDAPCARVYALIGADDLRRYTIQRDESVVKFLDDAVRDFWRRVLEGDPPPLNYEHRKTAETLARIFKVEPKTIAQATDAMRAYRDVYIMEGEREKQAAQLREGAKNRLLEFMRNAAILDFGDGTIFERKQVTRPAYVCPESTYVTATIRRRKPKAGADTPALPEEIQL